MTMTTLPTRLTLAALNTLIASFPADAIIERDAKNVHVYHPKNNKLMLYGVIGDGQEWTVAAVDGLVKASLVVTKG